MRSRKGSVHEGGVRVPLFVRWPGHVEQRTHIGRTAAHIDLMPTPLDLCEVPPPADQRGGSRALARGGGGEEDWPERMLFTHQPRRGDVEITPGALRTQQHRLIRDGGSHELYDMVADPGQKNDITADPPETVRELSSAYESWFEEVSRDGHERLPTPVGSPQAPRVELPVPECYFRGDVGYRGRMGWANDWIIGWESADDAVWWNLDVVSDGRYEITLRYVCPEENVGSRARIEIDGEALEGTIGQTHDPEPIPNPDRVLRGQVCEKQWAPLTLGEVSLKKGRAKLTVTAPEIPGAHAMDLKSVEVRRVD